MTLVWSAEGVAECPGCGGTVVVGIMSLCAVCPYDGFYYVPWDGTGYRSGWYSSGTAFRRGDAPL